MVRSRFDFLYSTLPRKALLMVVGAAALVAATFGISEDEPYLTASQLSEETGAEVIPIEDGGDVEFAADFCTALGLRAASVPTSFSGVGCEIDGFKYDSDLESFSTDEQFRVCRAAGGHTDLVTTNVDHPASVDYVISVCVAKT